MAAASDFGDVFPPSPSEAMMRWMSDNTVPEFEEEDSSQTAALSVPSSSTLVPTVSALGLDDSDSDGEIEVDIVEAQLRRGKQELASGDRDEAERYLRAGLDRLRRNEHRFRDSTARWPCSTCCSRSTTPARGGARRTTSWSTACRSCRAAAPRATPMRSATGTCTRCSAWPPSSCGSRIRRRRASTPRSASRPFRKMGPDGRHGHERALRLLVDVCRADGDVAEEEAYGLILADLVAANVEASATSVPVGEAKAPSLEEKTVPDAPRAEVEKYVK